MKHDIATYRLFFGSLANPNRLKIVNLLREQGELNVSQICELTTFEQTMVSHNLKRLETCGMVHKRSEGKHRFYSINKESIAPLMKLIDTHMHKYCEHVLSKENKNHCNK